MGRPTKEQIVKRDKIVSLNLIKRNNFIYRLFEKKCDYSDNSYLFALACGDRELSKSYSKINLQSCEHWSKIKKNPYAEKLNKLKTIDIGLFNYYSSLIAKARSDDKKQKDYIVTTTADANFIKEALGEQRFNEIGFYGIIHDKQDKIMIDAKGSPINNLNSKLDYMKDEDIQKIKDSIHQKDNQSSSSAFFKTIISRPIHGDSRRQPPINKNTFFIELDLTKSKKTLVDFIEKIKDDYDKSSKNIPNHYDLFNIKRDVFKNEFESYVNKTNQSKQLSEILADILFIYDCKMANFDYGTINQELKEYYNQGIKQKTISTYYDIAFDFIDKMKFKSFLTGLE